MTDSKQNSVPSGPLPGLRAEVRAISDSSPGWDARLTGDGNVRLTRTYSPAEMRLIESRTGLTAASGFTMLALNPAKARDFIAEWEFEAGRLTRAAAA